MWLFLLPEAAPAPRSRSPHRGPGPVMVVGRTSEFLGLGLEPRVCKGLGRGLGVLGFGVWGLEGIGFRAQG